MNLLWLLGVALAVALVFFLGTHPLGPGAAHGGRERRRRPGHGLRREPRAPAGHHRRRVPGRGGRLVPLALLPGQLERGAVERAGADGGGAGDLRPLAPAALPGRLPAVRRRRRPGPGAAVGGHHLRLLPVQRRPLRAHVGDHGRDQLRPAQPGRPAGRAGHRHAEECEQRWRRHDLRPRRSLPPGPGTATCARRTPRSSSSTCRPTSAARAATSTCSATTSRSPAPASSRSSGC